MQDGSSYGAAGTGTSYRHRDKLLAKGQDTTATSSRWRYTNFVTVRPYERAVLVIHLHATRVVDRGDQIHALVTLYDDVRCDS